MLVWRKRGSLTENHSEQNLYLDPSTLLGIHIWAGKETVQVFGLITRVPHRLVCQRLSPQLVRGGGELRRFSPLEETQVTGSVFLGDVGILSPLLSFSFPLPWCEELCSTVWSLCDTASPQVQSNVAMHHGPHSLKPWVKSPSSLTLFILGICHSARRLTNTVSRWIHEEKGRTE